MKNITISYTSRSNPKEPTFTQTKTWSLRVFLSVRLVFVQDKFHRDQIDDLDSLNLDLGKTTRPITFQIQTKGLTRTKQPPLRHPHPYISHHSQVLYCIFKERFKGFFKISKLNTIMFRLEVSFVKSSVETNNLSKNI